MHAGSETSAPSGTHTGYRAGSRAVDDTVLRVAVHHKGACITAPLGALPDEEGPLSFATQHLLCLCVVDLAHVPRAVLMVGEGVLILHQ